MNTSFENAQIIVCVGSGGVGKTTLSASLGFLAAQKNKRVLVLTIDPSQRLKTTLNLADDGEIYQVHHPLLEKTNGKLFAGVINAKKTFDEFVKKASKVDEVANRILKNKLYIQLSTTLSGSQEFTALEKLYSAKESNNYDLIILDTPPSQHAIDFLKAPQKLSRLFNEGIAKWFRDPKAQKIGFISSIVYSGTKQVLKILENLTGSEFMKQLADFFNNIESWQGQLDERVSAVHRLLVHPTTHFFLVTSFDYAKLKEAEYFNREIKKDGYQLTTIIINRAHPEWIDLRQEAQLDSQSKLAELYNQMKKYYSEREQMYSLFSKKMTTSNQVVRLPELESDIANITDIARFAEVIDKEFNL